MDILSLWLPGLTIPGMNSPHPFPLAPSHLAPDQVKDRYETQLAQGLMLMADVKCKCGTAVGYAFCGDRTFCHRNLHQVGRMGLVVSRFRVAPYQLPHAKIGA